MSKKKAGQNRQYSEIEFDDFEGRRDRRAGDRKKKPSRALCPFCYSNVNLPGGISIGYQATCTTCKGRLEVVWLDPVELDEPYR